MEEAVITPSILGTSHRIDIPVPELDDRLEPSQLLHVECACVVRGTQSGYRCYLSRRVVQRPPRASLREDTLRRLI